MPAQRLPHRPVSPAGARLLPSVQLLTPALRPASAICPRSNTYKATEMAKAQEDLAQRFADVASRASDSSSRQLARQILALLPRGGGNAEEIPGGLAHTMRTNNLREGHSNHNGIEDRFLEEWKRKLEGSTTQEDVAICEAYLHFLHCGDWNQFYKYIWDNHRITRDRLEQMDRPIRSPALHLPQLIPAMKHFLWVLKITHSASTLDESLEFAKGYLDEELKGLLYEILANRIEWFVPGKIADARARLAKVWRRPEVRGERRGPFTAGALSSPSRSLSTSPPPPGAD